MERITLILTLFEFKFFIYVTALITLVAPWILFVRYVSKRKDSKRLSFRNKFVIAIGAGVWVGIFVLIAYALVSMLTKSATVVSVYPLPNTELSIRNADIYVEFDVPIDTRRLNVNMFPKNDVPFEAVKSFPYFPYSRKVKLHSRLSYPPGESIMIYLSDMKNPLSPDWGSEFLLEYKAPPLPTVVKTDPANGAIDVPLDKPFVFYLSGDDSLANIWEVVSSPPITTEIKRMWNDTFEVVFNDNLPQSSSIHLTVFHAPAIVDGESSTIIEKGERKNVYTLEFSTAKEVSFSSLTKKPVRVVSPSPVNKEVSEVNLKVPFFKQEEDFTCNIAAARQLLAYRGVALPEQQLKSDIGSTGSRGNGNPYEVHVPDYGTYWDPVLRGVSKYRPARLFKEWNLKDLIGEIQKGNPVMIWGQNGWSDPHEISWTNPDRTFVYAINGMHSSVARGFRGPSENPTHILLNDPWRGVYWIPTAEFLRRWNFFKVALVVD